MQKNFELTMKNKFALYIRNKNVFMLKVNVIGLFLLKFANIFTG